MTIKPFFTFKEAIKSLWRNRLMSLASITSVSATLIILGIIFALIININSLAQSARDQFNSIQVYIVEGSDELTRETLGTAISETVGVSEVIYESSQDALEKMKDEWGDNAYLLEGIEQNPLPNSFLVYLDDIYYSEQVVTAISTYEGVDEIKSYQDVVERLISFTDFIRKSGMIVMFVLIAISTFIIHNTIKLAVNARHREINIMKYVGATNWFIRWPFLIEGTLLGMIGAGVATLVLKMGYEYLYGFLGADFYVIIYAYLITPNALMKDLMFLFFVIGSGIGALGSIWSMRKYLNV